MRQLNYCFVLVATLLIGGCSTMMTETEMAYWVDVRSHAEYTEQHYSPAINIPHTEIEQRIKEITTDKNATINLYCRSGGRAGKAKAKLESLGYTRVVNHGGLKDVLGK